MIQKNLKPIPETKYLSVENAWRYRGIMRQFYIFDQQYRHWIDKDELYKALTQQDAFSDYTPDQCKQDLDALVDWRNLSAVQDTNKVATYEQFKNRQFRYQMTEYAIEIERMTIRLENIFIEGGSLEPTLLERIKEEIVQMRTFAYAEPTKTGGWWSQLSSDYQRLNQNYQDYIRDWYSIKAEELMKSRSFLLYKEKLVDYLRHFIKELQQHAYEIERYLKQVTETEKELLVTCITQYEMEIPRLDLEAVSYEQVHDNILGKFESLFGFFVSSSQKDSEVERILSLTNEVIRRMTRSAAAILESSGQFSNRREEYKLLAERFLGMENLAEAHLLSANVFGIGGYKHFQGDFERSTEKIQSSMYEEDGFVVITSPRVRTYRERMNKTGIQDRSVEKAEMREKILKQKAEEQAVIEGYIREGKLVLSELGEIEPFVRHAFLRWLAKAMQSGSHNAMTEFGVPFRITNPQTEERCVLKSPDGYFELPAYALEFEVNA